MVTYAVLAYEVQLCMRCPYYGTVHSGTGVDWQEEHKIGPSFSHFLLPTSHELQAARLPGCQELRLSSAIKPGIDHHQIALLGAGALPNECVGAGGALLGHTPCPGEIGLGVCMASLAGLAGLGGRLSLGPSRQSTARTHLSCRSPARPSCLSGTRHHLVHTSMCCSLPAFFCLLRLSSPSHPIPSHPLPQALSEPRPHLTVPPPISPALFHGLSTSSLVCCNPRQPGCARSFINRLPLLHPYQ